MFRSEKGIGFITSIPAVVFVILILIVFNSIILANVTLSFSRDSLDSGKCSVTGSLVAEKVLFDFLNYQVSDGSFVKEKLIESKLNDYELSVSDRIEIKSVLSSLVNQSFGSEEFSFLVEGKDYFQLLDNYNVDVFEDPFSDESFLDKFYFYEIDFYYGATNDKLNLKLYVKNE